MYFKALRNAIFVHSFSFFLAHELFQLSSWPMRSKSNCKISKFKVLEMEEYKFSHSACAFDTSFIVILWLYNTKFCSKSLNGHGTCGLLRTYMLLMSFLLQDY